MTAVAESDEGVARAPGVVPACALFGTCGGCQYQHLAYDDQLALKTDALRALFAGLGADVASCVPCPAPYGYRSKRRP
jgi:23S rRNA (uracil1939-C5)-methyltransferase